MGAADRPDEQDRVQGERGHGAGRVAAQRPRQPPDQGRAAQAGGRGDALEGPERHGRGDVPERQGGEDEQRPVDRVGVAPVHPGVDGVVGRGRRHGRVRVEPVHRGQPGVVHVGEDVGRQDGRSQQEGGVQGDDRGQDPPRPGVAGPGEHAGVAEPHQRQRGRGRAEPAVEVEHPERAGDPGARPALGGGVEEAVGRRGAAGHGHAAGDEQRERARREGGPPPGGGRPRPGAQARERSAGEREGARGAHARRPRGQARPAAMTAV